MTSPSPLHAKLMLVARVSRLEREVRWLRVSTALLAVIVTVQVIR